MAKIAGKLLGSLVLLAGFCFVQSWDYACSFDGERHAHEIACNRYYECRLNGIGGWTIYLYKCTYGYRYTEFLNTCTPGYCQEQGTTTEGWVPTSWYPDPSTTPEPTQNTWYTSPDTPEPTQNTWYTSPDTPEPSWPATSEEPEPTRYSSEEPSSSPEPEPTWYTSEEPSSSRGPEPTWYTSEEPSSSPGPEPTWYTSEEPSSSAEPEPTRYTSEEPSSSAEPEPTRYTSEEPSSSAEPQPTRYTSEEPSTQRSTTEESSSAATPAPFECVQSGYFTDTIDCTKFHHCVCNANGCTDNEKQCPINHHFCEEFSSCGTSAFCACSTEYRQFYY